ncbi:hypothetical protein QBC43DRAFT_338458 [Cladorrhinum sp. PSN259]|nr:hypothetical protein QBC43DRAFT_338458 [Cladorrhinum sp. PSN259]
MKSNQDDLFYHEAGEPAGLEVIEANNRFQDYHPAQKCVVVHDNTGPEVVVPSGLEVVENKDDTYRLTDQEKRVEEKQKGKKRGLLGMSKRKLGGGIGAGVAGARSSKKTEFKSSGNLKDSTLLINKNFAFTFSLYYTVATFPGNVDLKSPSQVDAHTTSFPLAFPTTWYGPSRALSIWIWPFGNTECLGLDNVHRNYGSGMHHAMQMQMPTSLQVLELSECHTGFGAAGIRDGTSEASVGPRTRGVNVSHLKLSILESSKTLNFVVFFAQRNSQEKICGLIGCKGVRTTVSQQPRPSWKVLGGLGRSWEASLGQHVFWCSALLCPLTPTVFELEACKTRYSRGDAD